MGRIIGELHDEVPRGERRGERRLATRFGGDEYQTVLPNSTKGEAIAVAEEIRRRVEG